MGGARGRVRGPVAAVLALLLALLAACSGGSSSQEQRSLSPEARQRVTRAVDSFFADPTGYNDDVRALLVHVDGRPVVERYQHTGPGQAQDVASVTRAVVSVLVGIAVDEGRIEDVGATLAELLPDYAARMPAAVRSVTLHDLLTMTAGFHDDTPQWQAVLAGSHADVVAAVLRSPRVAPGRFLDTDAGTQLLSAVLERATGLSVAAWARARLFGPLGITGATWAHDAQGRSLAYDGLRIRPADLAKVGDLMAAGGVWHGVRVVSEDWVRQSTGSQVGYQQLVEPSGTYGYGWWVLDANGHPAFTAADLSGQVLEVVPDEGLVLVLTTVRRGASRVGFFGPLSWSAQVLVPVVERD